MINQVSLSNIEQYLYIIYLFPTWYEYSSTNNKWNWAHKKEREKKKEKKCDDIHEVWKIYMDISSSHVSLVVSYLHH